ncbi:bifunctional DNA-formamidopyrimidine glycosylase/DNA-(apurinic or apyrimidinic site) lyase [Aurantivibrio plasticivorans]
MPELPEVETTRRGIAPHLEKQRIVNVVVRQPKLRWPIPRNLKSCLLNNAISKVHRRGKYLLIVVGRGHLMMHLGMSGSLRVLPIGSKPEKHDHLDIELSSGQLLRYTDPRRFGSVLWVTGDPYQHDLLRDLGPEPLTDDFTGEYLFSRSRKRKVPIKQLIMDSKVVVGVGNIYANEALFMSGIRPRRSAGRLTRQQSDVLAANIKQVLGNAIQQGGTTLRDFTNSEGKPGYFSQSLSVYGRGGEACLQCQTVLKEVRLGQRSTVYCPSCQH